VIAVVIVTFSAEPAMLRECIDSVTAGGGVDRVIVVDNGTHAEVPSDIECV